MRKKLFLLSLSSVLTINLFASIMNANEASAVTKGLKDSDIKVLELKIKEKLIQKGYTLVDGRYSMIPFNFSIVWK